MRVLSPDACGATRRHQRIHACAECHGARVLKRPQGTRALQYCDEHPLALRTECSTTPKWRSVIPSAYMHVSAFTPHQCSFVYTPHFKLNLSSLKVLYALAQFNFFLPFENNDVIKPVGKICPHLSNPLGGLCTVHSSFYHELRDIFAW